MSALRVSLHGEEVGALTQRADGRISFRLSRGYAEQSSRAVLGQCFEDDPHRVWTESAVGHAPRWFANLLPEREGPLRAIIAQAHDLDGDDDFGLLRVLGEDLPGAVQVAASEVQAWADEPTFHDRPKTEHEPTDGLRFSLAGIQLKFSVAVQGDRITLPLRGESGRSILKAARSKTGVVGNEHAMLGWARAVGFDVAQAAVVPLPNLPGLGGALDGAADTALLVTRFDRVGALHVHQEDFAQVTKTRPKDKYKNITYDQLARLVDAVLGPAGALEFVRRLALMVAQGNADAHLKNWSLRYPDRTKPTWSPLYDLVSVIAWPEAEQELAFKLAGHKRFQEIDLPAFVRLGARAGLDPKQVEGATLETLVRLRDSWPSLPERETMLEPHTRRLCDHWGSVPLLRRIGPLKSP